MEKHNEAVRWASDLPDGPLGWVEATTRAGVSDLVLPVRLRETNTRPRRGVRARRRPGAGPAGFLDSSPGLFKAFARLEPTEDRLLAFAQEWGYLGLWDELAEPVGSPSSGVGERLSAWRDAHRLIANGVRLWDALKSADGSRVGAALTAAPLRRYEVTEGLGEPSYPTQILSMHVRLDALTDEIGRSHVSFRRKPAEGEPIDVTGWYLLGEYVDHFVSITNSVRLRQDRDKGQYSTTFEPQNLWGAMWLSFALAVSDVTSVEECANCHTVFVERVRSSKTHCNTCRKALSADRSSLARRLAKNPMLSEDTIMEAVLSRYPVDDSYRDRTVQTIGAQVRKARA